MSVVIEKETFGPAPWAPHDIYPDDIVDAESHLVASVYGRYDGSVKNPKPDTCRAEANRRLIFAAPDGLALAQHILALETDPYMQGHPEWEAFLNEAMALVNKVRGK